MIIHLPDKSFICLAFPLNNKLFTFFFEFFYAAIRASHVFSFVFCNASKYASPFFFQLLLLIYYSTVQHISIFSQWLYSQAHVSTVLLTIISLNLSHSYSTNCWLIKLTQHYHKISNSPTHTPNSILTSYTSFNISSLTRIKISLLHSTLIPKALYVHSSCWKKGLVAHTSPSAEKSTIFLPFSPFT